MTLSKTQRGGFEDRLSRIKKGGANTMGEVHIGPRDEVRAKKGKTDNTVRMKTKQKNVKIGEGSNSALIPLAMFFGAMSMFVGQAAAYHLFQEGGLIDLDLSMPAVEPYLPYAHYAIGGFLALTLGWTFRMLTAVRILALAAGLFVMVQYQTDIMQRVPGLYASFFSKAYVSETLSNA